MEKNLNLKQDFTVSLKPNRLFFKVIGDVSKSQCDIYYELIYDHYEDVEITPIENNIDESLSGSTENIESIFEKQFKYSITLFKGNEIIPTQYLIPVLSGDIETTNLILSGFKWFGPFDGLVISI